eukprot:TRINITY_DN37269_c0_g1_i1.p1 TRINITY_DN37269_c0_g1~~TRINITY_DN37269_c0_g1_i1.p1  ORF type:complete len:472 (+),score=85.38 TRINITY_DN37269_c0_g1_i1:85-1416(+)
MAGSREQVRQWCLLFMARAFCQGTRLLLGALLPVIAEPSWTVQEKGQLLGVFSMGYMLLQVTGGSLADSVGGKSPLLLALVVTGVMLLVSATAPEEDYLDWLAACQLLMGLVQGVTYPADCSLRSRWTDAECRAVASAVCELGSPTGAFLAVTLGPLLGGYLGWRNTFIVYGLATLAASLVFALLCQSCPAEDSARKELSIDEDAEATAGIADESSEMLWTLRLGILRHASTWALFFAHSVFNISKYFVFNWMPTFFVEVLEVSLQRAGTYLLVPVLIEALGSLYVGARNAAHERQSGRLSDSQRTKARRNHSSGAFILTGLCVMGCGWPMLQNVGAITLLIAMESASTSFHAGGFRPNYMDVTQLHSGFVAGVGNTLATFATFAGAIGVGNAISSFGWSSAFVLVFAMNWCGAFVFNTWASGASRDTKVPSRVHLPALGKHI